MDLHLSDLPIQAVRHPEVVVFLVLAGLLLGQVAWWLAARRGWWRAPAVLAAGGLALALAVTVVRPFGNYPAGGLDPSGVLRECVVGSLSLGRTYERLNVAMLMPFAFFAVLATRRPIAVIAACALLSGGVEYIQGATGGGTCQARDLVHNIGGGLIAVLLALGAARLLHPGGRGPGVVREAEPVSAGCGAGRGSSP